MRTPAPEEVIAETLPLTSQELRNDYAGTLGSVLRIDCETIEGRVRYASMLCKAIDAPTDARRHQQPWDILNVFAMLPFTGRSDEHDDADQCHAERVLWKFAMREVELICARNWRPASTLSAVRTMMISAHWFFGGRDQAWRLEYALQMLDWFADTSDCWHLDSGILVDCETAARRRFLARRRYDFC